MTMTFDLPADLEQEIRAELTARLPPTVDGTLDSLQARDLFALTAVADLKPHNRAEAMLAVQAITATAHAHHYLYLAGQHRADVTEVIRCRSKAIAKMQESHKAFAALRALRQARIPALAATGGPAPMRKAAPRRRAQFVREPLDIVTDAELIEHLIEARKRVLAPTQPETTPAAKPQSAANPQTVDKPQTAAPAFHWPPISPTIH